MINKLRYPKFLNASFLLLSSILLVACNVSSFSKNDSHYNNRFADYPTKKIKSKKYQKLPDRLIPVLAESIGRDDASYHIKKDPKGDYKAITHRHKFTTTFTAEGIKVEPLTSEPSPWHLSMTLTGIGYGNNIKPATSPKLTTEANRVNYLRDNLKEWYINSPFGLEQGFTIDTPPSLDNKDESLVLELEFSGDLKPVINKNRKGIVWKKGDRKRVFNYTNLYAYDSKGKVLPSYLSVSESTLSIMVDDNGAKYPITIDPIIKETKIRTASDPDILAYYGRSVGISGDVAVVGSPGDNDNGDSSGSAYILSRNQGGPHNWGEFKKLTSSDAVACDLFGFSVDVSGDTIAVGANTVTTSSCPPRQGAVYVFEKDFDPLNPSVPLADNWGEIKKLTASDGAAGNQLGSSVAIDGDIIVIGAPGDSQNGDGSGAAYVFYRNQGDPDNWVQVAKLIASDGVFEDSFGFSVSIFGDTAVVGAPAHFALDIPISGAAYVFYRDQGGPDKWGQVKELTDSDVVEGEGDVFGISVSISVDTIVVGAGGDDSNQLDSGSVYFFDRNTGGTNNWGEVTKLIASDDDEGDVLGSSVSIDLNTTIVGAPGDDNGGSDSGAAYVTERNASVWGSLEKLTASDAGPGTGVLSGLGVFKVDNISGDREIVSDSVTGSGPLFLEPEGIAVENFGQANESLLVVDKGFPGILRVDPTTGNRFIAHDNSGNPSVPFTLPVDIAIKNNGDLVVTDMLGAIVININSTNGSRSVVNNTVDYPALGLPFGIAVDSSGNVVVTDLQLVIEDGYQQCFDCIFDDSFCDPPGVWPDCAAFGCVGCPDISNPAVARINSSTGVVQELADTTSCAGRPFNRPLGITMLADGNFAVVAIYLNESTGVIEDVAILKIDSVTGVCSILSDETHGTGPNLQFPEGITFPVTDPITLQDRLAVADNFRKEVVLINPDTGDRTIVSGGAIGNGPPLEEPFWIAVKSDGTLAGTDQGTTGINFGVSVDISGKDAIIGAPGRSNFEGAVYIFQFCEEADPASSASPESQTSGSGDSLSYTVSVQNNCNLACSSKDYNLSGVVPTGWTSNFSPSTVNLDPGQTADVIWSVSSAAEAPEGSYQITAHVVDSGDSTFNNLANATYTVDNNPPTTVCGDGTCAGVGAGEDCDSCPADCIKKTKGKNQFCCGNLLCEKGEDSLSCEVDCGSAPPAPVCGDGTCDTGEDSCSCATDCGTPPLDEVIFCTDGVDNDCDGSIDCNDADCSSDPSCSCSAIGFLCSDNGDCCSNKCKGRTGAKVCK